MIRPWHPSPRPPQIHPRHLPRRAFYTAPRTRPWRAGRVVCRLGARARPRGVGTLAGEVRAWGTSFLMIKGDLRASVRKTGGSSGTVRIIVSIAQTTCSDCFRPYIFTAQNSSLTSWSGPAPMGGLGYHYIDTYVVKSGSTYHAFT